MKVKILFSTFVSYIANIYVYAEKNYDEEYLANANIKTQQFYRKEKNDLIYIPGGMMYRNGIGNRESKLVKVKPFMVFDHKITNKEYRDILLIAKKRRLRNKAFLRKMVPNYSQVINTLKDYGINESIMTDYFLKEDNCPVVGLTYSQILEFIKLKSEIDGKNYRLMTPDEFDFCAYEVKNVQKADDTDIIQMEFFDDNIKNKIQIINEGITNANNEIDKKLNGNNKKNKKKKNNKTGKVGNMNSFEEKRPLEIYRPSDYFNLREKVFRYNASSPMFTPSYKYKPNGFLIYDLIGNTYEITKENFDPAEDFNISNDPNSLNEKLTFILCGGSCFDYYDNVKIERKLEDNYESIRFDRGFRLVLDTDR